jgi:hypothetical protein
LPLARPVAAGYIKAMDSFAPIVLAVALAAVVAVLFAGLFAMARGGEFNRKYGNKLMRWRVVLQGSAIVLFALAMWLARG